MTANIIINTQKEIILKYVDDKLEGEKVKLKVLLK